MGFAKAAVLMARCSWLGCQGEGGALQVALLVFEQQFLIPSRLSASLTSEPCTHLVCPNAPQNYILSYPRL